MANTAKNILLVEDEAIIAMNTARMLEERGYTVEHAIDGKSALARVAAAPETIDLLLMDINLGEGITGSETAREILRSREIPIVFLSSHTEKSIVESTEEISSYGYVVKNSGITVLDASIRMAFRLFEARKSIHAKNMAFEATNEQLRVTLEELTTAYGKLELSEDKFLKAFRMNPDSIIICRLSDGVVIDANEGATTTTGYTREEAINRSTIPGDLGLWARSEDRQRMIRELRETGEVNGLEAEFRRKDGSIFAGVISAKVIEIEGEECILSFTRDITEQKRMERALRESDESLRRLVDGKETLMKELQHRVKNNFNVVTSLLNLEEAKCSDDEARGVLSKAVARVRLILAIYERLYLSEDLASVDLSVYIEDLANSIFTTYNLDPERVSLRIRADRVRLDTKRSVPLGLILNELISNALKYAYPVGRRGELRVELKLRGSEISLEVSDDGSGIPDEYLSPGSPSMGMTLVRMLARQIGAAISIDNKGGTRVRLSFEA
jgi:PAS domain S-box-containing protein